MGARGETDASRRAQALVVILDKAMLAAALLVAATQPQTMEPRITGSMYNGNNVQPPDISTTDGSEPWQSQTTRSRSQGTRASEGGGG